jgi:hypothetical protein
VAGLKVWVSWISDNFLIIRGVTGFRNRTLSSLISLLICVLNYIRKSFKPSNAVVNHKVKGKGKGHPCTGTEALYRPYGP